MTLTLIIMTILLTLNTVDVSFNGATTLSITTFSITTFDIMVYKM
jgi:hypothetical protein